MCSNSQLIDRKLLITAKPWLRPIEKRAEEIRKDLERFELKKDPETKRDYIEIGDEIKSWGAYPESNRGRSLHKAMC